LSATVVDPIGSYQASRTLAVLERLTTRPHSVPQLAEELQLAKLTVRRIVKVLEHADYVERVPDDNRRKRYRIGPRARPLGYRMATADADR